MYTELLVLEQSQNLAYYTQSKSGQPKDST